MERFRAKLAGGDTVCVAFGGDSICRGNDAPTPSQAFVSLWADEIHRRHGCRLVVTNLSQGGATIRDAYKMLRGLKGPRDYDLFVLAVGVNDAASGVSVRRFSKTLEMIHMTCADAGISLLVVTPLNPTNVDVSPYVKIMRDSGLPLADVNAVWNGQPLANGINHPDAEGHRLYADVLLRAT